MFGQDPNTPATSSDPFADLDTPDLRAYTAPAKELVPAKPMTSAEAYDALNTETSGVFVEVCSKCRGSGIYYGRSRHGQKCFPCKGAGKFTFRTSPEERAKAKASRENRKAKAKASAWETYAEANPLAAEWMVAAAGRGFNFAVEMRAAVERYGHLTERQAAAVERFRLADIERAERKAREAEERAAREANAPKMEMERLEAAFSAAKASGLKRPKLRVSSFVFSPAPMTGKNAGAIYVKRGETYLGKVAAGKFVRSFQCDEVTEGEVLAAGADPLSSAVAYGRLTGACACCGRELSDPESVARGIGPVCAGKWGL